MDKKIIYTGTDIFEDLIRRNGYYVDKTKIIEELFINSSRVTLFPRPRRFGKTLTMSMLTSFFDIEKDSKELFKGLYIEKSSYYEYMNKYPVIFLTFKGIGMNTFEDTEKEFISLVSKLYIQKRYVMKRLINSEKRIYETIMDKTADISEYRNAIANMVEYLYRYHGKQVIVLIDEYDDPIHKGYINKYYKEIIDLIRKVFDGIFKTNDNLFFAVLTGVLKVSKESLLSDPNNIDVYGLMSKEYNDLFGFTEEETKKLLEYYGLELTNDIKSMYDGYNVCGVSLYNPWSIMCYTKRKKLDNYWINTSGNELIRIMLNDTSDENKAKIEKLIQGESIAFTYDDKLTYKNFDDHSDINILLNLFFASGYLTLDRIDNDPEFGLKTYVKVPNKEVNELLVKIMTENVYGSESSSNIDKITSAIRNNDKELLENTLNDMLLSTSFMDNLNESGYHNFMLGIFTLYLNNSNFIVKSNREGGSGRFDVMIESANREYGYIFEFKIAGIDEDMESIAKNALDQIETKEYYKELVLDKVKQVQKVSIVFSNKKCIVR